jgi:hypothetical protein
MSTILIDLATAAKLSEPRTTVEVRTEDGTLVGVFTPQREATEEDYQWAMQQFTAEHMEASLNSGPFTPAAEVIANLRRQYGP